MLRAGWPERNREWLITLAGTLAVVLVRLWFGRQMNFCGTPDSCSYLALAESLSRHHGFVEHFLFDFQVDQLRFPAHGIEYWLPGTSFFLLLAKPFGGVTLHSSIVISTLMGVFLSMAAWKIAIDYSGSRRLACAAYLLCLVMPPMWFGSITPDSVLFYGAFVAWSLALFRASFVSYRDDALALLCLVVACLIRNDAVLLLVPVLAVLWLRRRSPGARGASPAYCAVAIVSFLCAMIPVHLIDYAVLGNAFPSAIAKVFLMRDLADMGRYNDPVTLRTFLALGARRLVSMRAAALPLILYRIVFLLIGFAGIFIPALLMRRETEDRPRRPEVAAGAAFALTLILVYSLVLPAIKITVLRSFCALLPLCAVLIVAGIRWIASSGRVAVWLTASTIAFYAVGGLMEDRRTVPETNELGAMSRALAASLQAHGANPGGGSLIMTVDPVQFSETTAYSAIPLPENGFAAARQAADRMGVTHVLIDSEAMAGKLDEARSALEPVDVWAVPEAHAVVLRLPQARSAR